MTDAQVKVGVDTSEGVANLKKLERASKDAKQELSSFDKIVGTAFGARNIFQVTNFNRALTSMVDTLKTVSLVLVGANAAIVTFFSSIVKELNRLQGFISIMSLSAKGVEGAVQQFMFLRSQANLLGIDLNVLLNNYAKLTAAIPDSNEKFAIAQKLFTGLAMAARTLHASTLDTQLMFYAVTQIASKGIVSMEELRRQLGERLPGALEIAARSVNTTAGELEKAIRKGIVQSVPFLKFFGDELIRTFAESADIAANTVDAALNRLKNVWVDFVKAVLDSGAGQAIIRVFDELRTKLADPYLMSAFATALGDIANKVADFVKSLTSEDILNAFNAVKTGIEVVVSATLKLIDAMTWVINNSKTVGAVLGGIFGASKGAAIGFMFGGPTGAAIGAGIGGAAGVAGGLYLGHQVAPNAQQESAYFQMQREANRVVEEQQRQVGVMLQSVMGSLGALGFSSENMSTILPMIEKRLGFNVDTAAKFASLIYDKKFKNLQERQAAALTLSSTGQVLGPRGTLEEIIGGPAKGKAEKEKRLRLQTTKDLQKEGLQYIEMLQKQMVKEEQLTEVEKLWRAVAEGRVAFYSEENFLRAKAIAQKIDEANATQALTKASAGLNETYQDQIDKIQDVYDQGLLTKSELAKQIALREYDQKVMEEIGRITLPEVKTAAQELAAVLRNDLETSIDRMNEKMRQFSYGWQKSLKDYIDLATNSALAAENIFTVAVNGLEDLFVQFARTGKVEMKSLVDTIIAEMARLAARPIVAWLMQAGSDFLGRLLNSQSGDGFVANPIAGYAMGGRVRANEPIWVGEQGAELFTPKTAGTITPNHKLGGTTININNYSNSEVSVSESEDVSGSRIDILIDKKIQSSIAQGKFDNTFRANFGLARRGV